MKMKALDQIHISAVKADSLRPGEEFEVSDSLGQQLLREHPGRVTALGAKSAPSRRDKADPSPLNKSTLKRSR